MDSVCSGIIDSERGVCKEASSGCRYSEPLTKTLILTVFPMQLDVAQQLRQAVGTVTRFGLQEPSLTVNDAVLQGLTGSVTPLRPARGLLVSLQGAATIHERCSRCLAGVSCPISIDLQEEYIPEVDVITGAPVPLSEPSDLFR